MKPTKPRRGNPVAKHCREFNKATIEADRKKQLKRGKRKHKRDWSCHT